MAAVDGLNEVYEVTYGTVSIKYDGGVNLSFFV